MAVLPVISPRVVGTGGIDTGNIRAYSLGAAAAFREGDFVYLPSTTTVTPNPTGALASYTGPTFAGIAQVNANAVSTPLVSGNVTITGIAQAGAPAQTYYNILTYASSASGAQESLPGTEFIVNCAAGYTYSVNVTSAGGTGAGYYSAYASYTEGSEVLQTATTGRIAINTPTLIFNSTTKLVYSTGLQQCPAAANTNITGLALHDSQSLWAYGVGGSYTAGGISQLLGAWMPPPTLGPVDPQQALVVSALNNQVFEVSIQQTWTNALIGSAVGILLDATSGYMAFNTSAANKPAIIVSKAFGAPSDVGGVGDTNVRANIIFTSGVI